jgi:tetraprenyl-beta-curcumene synthase
VAGNIRSRLALVNSFTGAAARYWLAIFPLLSHELRHYRERAGAISDPILRTLALETQQSERGNLEGAAAFAVLVPHRHRAHTVRALVTFQAIYDYVDSLAEQPCDDPVANGRQLHLALLSAVDPELSHADYYKYNSINRDDDYIEGLVERCRRSLATLPSYRQVAEAATRCAQRMVDYQSLNHGAPGESRSELAAWASATTPASSGLRWWETAAGAASSLSVFSLIAAAARPWLDAGETAAVENAYFPWIGALHVLLDSLIDHQADMESGDHSLVAHYISREEASGRLGAIASRSMRATTAMPQGHQHALLLASMTSFYLSAPAARTPAAAAIGEEVREAMGRLATPTMAVLRARRVAAGTLGAFVWSGRGRESSG